MIFFHVEGWRQYGSVKARDAINRRLYNNQSFVETAIYRVFALRLAACHQKTLSEPYWGRRGRGK
ncbi:hypothetical protein [Nostoc sp.]|uniref:hypothetical protein n=1 Tax=Nostoc sp. TaxID=1180 RepID=UPI002FFCBEC4